MDPHPDDRLARIIKMFRAYNGSEETLMSKQKLTEILNKQANINLHHGFNPNILQEIWGQAETTSRGESTVLTFAKIYSQAMKILEDRIGLIDCPTGLPQKTSQLITEQNKLRDLEAQYQQGLLQNYDKINVVRKNIVAIQTKIAELNKNKNQFKRDLEEMDNCLEVEEKPSHFEKSEYIVQSRLSKMSESISPAAPSPHLNLIFKVCCLALLLQMLFITFYSSFLPLLCYLFIIYWLFLGYYDHNFVKIIILGLALGSLLDFTCIILEFIGKLGENRFYGVKKAWFFPCIIILIIQIALRLLLIIKLCLFRQPSAKREYFTIFDHQIQLNTRSGKTFSNRILPD